MRHYLFFFFSVCIGSLSFSQISSEDQINTTVTKPAPPSYSDAKAAPFWTEDFGNGFPSGWAVVDSSGICPWTHSYDGSYGYYSDNGTTGSGAIIASTTSGNGFLICDADSANHATYGQPSGSTYQYLSSYFATSAINCSGHSSVILTFEQFYRYNNGVDMNVMVSNDSTNWTTFDVSGGLANNTSSANPDLVTLNITNIAANQPNVYFIIGWSARVYHWQIDDMALSEADPNDLVLENNWWGTGNFQYQHYKIPLSQASPITFYSEISNNTGNTLSNVFSDVTVTNTGGVVFQSSSNTGTLAAVELDTFIVNSWTPSVADLHDVDYVADLTGATDGNLSNNSFADQLEITNSIYGLDNLQDPQGSTGQISNFASNTGQPFKIGNLYEIMYDDGVQCVEIGISDDPDNDGQEVFAEVYAWNPTTQEFDMRGYSDIYTIQTSDLGTILNFPLASGEAMFTAGEEMLVVGGHYGGAGDGSDDVGFMYGQPVENRMVWGFNAGGDALWLSNPRAIVARANFNCGLGTEELNAAQVSIYPNPANEKVQIESNGTFGIEIKDLNGRTIKRLEQLENSIEIETTSFASGVYTIVVTTENDESIEKLIVQ